ncbi:MAG: hypothetical protein LBR19_01290 [Bifidobacteriaceae bacterium]|jgi:hypothetical protein|nr:hypothetical protein [Bifidobacteriaceae bacterium]
MSHATLVTAMETPGYGIDNALVFAETNTVTRGGVTYLPGYLATCLCND